MTHLYRNASAGAEHEAGFTIVELMVAMAVSLLLLGGVVAIFTSSKTTYERVERLSQIQENGRFALNAIVRDIRSAGYLGCARPSTFTNTLNSATALAWNFENAVSGYEFQSGTTWSPALPPSFTTAATGAANGSDAIVLRVPAPGATSASLRLVEKMTSPTAPLKIAPVGATDAAPLRSSEQVIMVADCQARATFEITGYTKTTGEIEHAASGATGTTPGNATDNIGHEFEANSQIVPIQTVAYFVGVEAGRPPSLWRIRGSGAAEELVEGVERMELRFGLDTTGDRIADTYASADAIADWDSVINVSVALLVRSMDEYGEINPVANSYILLDKTFNAPADRHVRQVFVTTATLRNRAL